MPELPQGQLTATGTILPVELSLVRRGTHKLVVDGEPLYFLESRSVDLRPFESTTVGVTGTLSRNTDADDLPVLAVSAVRGNQAPVGKQVSLPSFKMSLVVPQTWEKKTEGSATVFVASGTQSLLRVGPSPLPSLPEDGVLLLLGGRKAARTFSSMGVEQLTVDAFGTLVLLELPPFTSADPSLVTERVAVMRSITFTGTAQSSATSPASATSSKSGTYCGGAAGILCPQGSVCIITDTKENIGFCKTVNKPTTGVQ